MRVFNGKYIYACRKNNNEYTQNLCESKKNVNRIVPLNSIKLDVTKNYKRLNKDNNQFKMFREVKRDYFMI